MGNLRLRALSACFVGILLCGCVGSVGDEDGPGRGMGEGLGTPSLGEATPEETPKPSSAPDSDPMPDPDLEPDPFPEPDPDPEPDPTSPPDCRKPATWDPTWAQWEAEVLMWTNVVRARGTTCGGTGYPAVAALSANPQLQEAARCHSVDMVVRDFFKHENPDGVSSGCRIWNTGYCSNRSGENIAYGHPNPKTVVDEWEKSTGHCKNIMNGDFSQLGVGAYVNENGTIYWTQNFGNPGNGACVKCN